MKQTNEIQFGTTTKNGYTCGADVFYDLRAVVVILELTPSAHPAVVGALWLERFSAVKTSWTFLACALQHPSTARGHIDAFLLLKRWIELIWRLGSADQRRVGCQVVHKEEAAPGRVGLVAAGCARCPSAEALAGHPGVRRDGHNVVKQEAVDHVDGKAESKSETRPRASHKHAREDHVEVGDDAEQQQCPSTSTEEVSLQGTLCDRERK